MATTAANASSSTSICTICQTLADEKPKPGILPCLGCQQLFCYQHIGQHRQNLADQLDTVVINERNNLFENISKLEENCDQYVEQQLKEINDWELKSFEIIKETAENARLTLHAMALNECVGLRERFTRLTTELTNKQQTDNYFEQDIQVLKHKFQQLKHDIESFGLKVHINSDLKSIELISIKKKPSASDSFIDHLLLTQTPIKYINARNSGKIYAVNENLLAFEHRDARDIDLYDTVDLSMKTMSRTDDGGFNLCYSTYLQSFLYLIQSRRPEWYHLYQWSIIGHGEPKKMELNISEKIYQITCYETNLLVLFYSFTIEKWKLNSLKLDTRWRKPMTCEQDESIKMIRMNSLYYALVVEKPDGCYFELRNNSMLIIGSVKIIYDYYLELISLPNEIGWLLFYHYNTRNTYIIDNQLNKHEQKFMEALQVKDIVTQGKYMIIRYDKQANDISKTKKDCIEYYQWH
ncbi:unnamed protein product [Rotaria socialis]|uniref:Uncharacterized protein n=1 Tax=Rotaria socialis TaxID=392032 RepID=A0A817QML2_9BILA|nr:unnamed protein product [Rotaria socialis]CAF3536135.1 unnamed protein product [Rotaria socialis]CAF4339474.1 unnamed protein product [Rotaria socialis]CAF4432844.1 unnamed protein product [Rotaria socialis]